MLCGLELRLARRRRRSPARPSAGCGFPCRAGSNRERAEAREPDLVTSLQHVGDCHDRYRPPARRPRLENRPFSRNDQPTASPWRSPTGIACDPCGALRGRADWSCQGMCRCSPRLCGAARSTTPPSTPTCMIRRSAARPELAAIRAFWVVGLPSSVHPASVIVRAP